MSSNIFCPMFDKVLTYLKTESNAQHNFILNSEAKAKLVQVLRYQSSRPREINFGSPRLYTSSIKYGSRIQRKTWVRESPNWLLTRGEPFKVFMPDDHILIWKESWKYYLTTTFLRAGLQRFVSSRRNFYAATVKLIYIFIYSYRSLSCNKIEI